MVSTTLFLAGFYCGEVASEHFYVWQGFVNIRTRWSPIRELVTPANAGTQKTFITETKYCITPRNDNEYYIYIIIHLLI